MNKTEIDIQIASTFEHIPVAQDITRWTMAALQKRPGEITIRIVDEEESAELNHTYRKKNGPTNVLSFPLTSPHQKDTLLGDIIICAQIVHKEAQLQQKPLLAHWAHLTIHGILHLQGFDHINRDDAITMEQLEINILDSLGFKNPYE